MTEITEFYDPGKLTGWARFTDLGTVVSFGTTYDGEVGIVEHYKELRAKGELPQRIVYEAFRIWPKKDSKGTDRRTAYSANERKGLEVTLRVVGALEMIGGYLGIPVIVQEVRCKLDGYAWQNLPKTNIKEFEHERDALAHGYFYYYDRGILKIKRKHFD